MQEKPGTFCIAIVLSFSVIIAVYIRLHGIGAYHHSHYIFDELLHMDIAKGKDISEVVRFSLQETHPPFGHILRHYWIMVSDNPEFSRLLSLVFGIALIPLYYYIGKTLHTPLTGLYAAMLIVFGHGVIIQSYAVRNYTIFLFFLSLGFLNYLHWRVKHSPPLLLLYGICILLACLTHFSGIFGLFSITVYETILLLKAKQKKGYKIQWISLNSIILLIVVCISGQWHTTAMPLFFMTENWYYYFGDLRTTALFYPLFALYYILPSHLIAIAAIPVTLLGAYRDARLRSALLLPGIALGIGMVLFITGLYHILASRHNLWLLPFTVPFIAWSLAVLCPARARQLLLLSSITGLCWLSYDATARFNESQDTGIPTEYQHQPAELEIKEVTKFLQTLDSSSMVLASRTEAFFISGFDANPYQYMHSNAVNRNAVALMPYYNTTIAFGSSYYPMDSLLTLIHNPLIQKGLEGKNQLVFISSSLVSLPEVDKLVNCPELDKKIIAFPTALHNNEKPPLLMLVISRHDFEMQVLAAGGKAYRCVQH